MKKIWALFYGTDVSQVFISNFASEHGAQIVTVEEAIQIMDEEVEYRLVVDKPKVPQWRMLRANAEEHNADLKRLRGSFSDGVGGMFNSTIPKTRWIEQSLEG